jgi:hypothetical protein
VFELADDLSTTGPVGSSALLGTAALVLQSHGYSTQYLVLEGSGQLLLATDPLFLVGIAKFESAADLPGVEARSSITLGDQIVEAGPRRWDSYLVLLTSSEREDFELSESVAEITYNTQYHRRMIRWGLLPTEESLTDALRPFLPLPSANVEGPRDPVRLLAERMQLHGLDSSDVAVALAQWNEEGRTQS